MKRTRIKFCGMTREVDIDAAIELGVDAIGLILVPGSKRELSLERAAALADRVPPLVSVVCLVANKPALQVNAVLAAMRVDLLQFHGNETDSQCTIHGKPFVKAVAMGDDDAALQLESWPSAAGLVLDGHRRGELGGQGRSFNWSARFVRPAQPLLLAGGLNPDNVAEAIEAVEPFAVDVSSGIESAPGIKDRARMEAFIKEVNRVDRERE